MPERLDYVSINMAAITSMANAKTKMPLIDARLRALIELRVSQINGCVYFPQSGLKPPTLVGKTFKRAPKALMNH